MALERKVSGLEDSLEEVECNLGKEQHEKADLVRKLTASENWGADLRSKGRRVGARDRAPPRM